MERLTERERNVDDSGYVVIGVQRGTEYNG